jgi:hypothetical protein
MSNGMRPSNSGPPGPSSNGHSYSIKWGIGRAFVCTPADCGTEVKVYLRPKNGFCNCSPGDIDDEELDRVGDKELIAPEAVASSRADSSISRR